MGTELRAAVAGSNPPGPEGSNGRSVDSATRVAGSPLYCKGSAMFAGTLDSWVLVC